MRKVTLDIRKREIFTNKSKINILKTRFKGVAVIKF